MRYNELLLRQHDHIQDFVIGREVHSLIKWLVWVDKEIMREENQERMNRMLSSDLYHGIIVHVQSIFDYWLFYSLWEKVLDDLL